MPHRDRNNIRVLNLNFLVQLFHSAEFLFGQYSRHNIRTMHIVTKYYDGKVLKIIHMAQNNFANNIIKFFGFLSVCTSRALCTPVKEHVSALQKYAPINLQFKELGVFLSARRVFG